MKLTVVMLVLGMMAAAVPAAAQKQTGEVYLYRKDREYFLYSFIFTRKLPVWFADPTGDIEAHRTIASLKRGRYFKLSLSPGTYFFDTKYFSGSAKIELAAGERQFLRFDHGTYCGSEDKDRKTWETPSCEEKDPYIEVMTEAEALTDLMKLKPISKGDVKEKGFVIVPTTPPGK